MKAMITIFLIISISTISNACLNLHNTYRSRHQQTPPLRKPSSRLQTYANKRAQELAGTDNFSHPTNCPYGENLFMGYGKDFNCKDAIKSWYDEIKIYNYNQASFSKQCGHFTQIVWKGTREVACARSKSRKSGNVYVVCNYSPRGNVMGRFRENVRPKITKSKITKSKKVPIKKPPEWIKNPPRVIKNRLIKNTKG